MIYEVDEFEIEKMKRKNGLRHIYKLIMKALLCKNINHRGAKALS